MTVNPFVVGQWVRGSRFYGRRSLIDAILTGNRNCLWVLGTRRIGKTSLLKQVELLAERSPEQGYFPLFWDFQGADDPDDLNEGFADALLDAEPRLEDCGIAPDDVAAPDVFGSLNKLRRALRRKKLKVLLLCDEVEELIGLKERDPLLLRKLRRAMQSRDDVRSVLASKIKLWELSQEEADTSPFLEGFTPPLYIRPLEDDEARALIRQANLPEDSRPRFDDETVELVRERCNNHPYLIQMLCEKYTELNDLQAAIDQLASDPMVSYFFSVDFEMLSEIERGILITVARRGSSTTGALQQELSATSGTLDGSMHQLENLGYVRRDATGRLELANFFFQRWFREVASQGSPDRESKAPASEALRSVSMPMSATSLGSDPEPDPNLGRFDERYELLERAGTGAMGVVYKAFDDVLRVHLAIKILRSVCAANPDAVERFRREIVLTRDMAHPNILRLYHLGEFEGKRYLTMQWVNGPTLGQLIARHAPLPLERFLRIACGLASALEMAHGHRVVHRDIKAQNILIEEGDRPKLTDFGLARAFDDPAMTRDGVFMGTPDYASPEQANLKPLDQRSDLYSLGVVFYEMLDGARPFAGTVTDILEMHRNASPPLLSRARPEIPRELHGIVMRCLKKDPRARYQTAGELRAALEALRSD